MFCFNRWIGAAFDLFLLDWLAVNLVPKIGCWTGCQCQLVVLSSQNVILQACSEENISRVWYTLPIKCIALLWKNACSFAWSNKLSIRNMSLLCALGRRGCHYAAILSACHFHELDSFTLLAFWTWPWSYNTGSPMMDNHKWQSAFIWHQSNTKAKYT